MHLGFKYRVYPTEEQKVFFAKIQIKEKKPKILYDK